jgi:hypothetical protein
VRRRRPTCCDVAPLSTSTTPTTTSAGEFRGKSLYRFAYGDSSLPLNGTRLYDDADDAWGATRGARHGELGQSARGDGERPQVRAGLASRLRSYVTVSGASGVARW